MIQLTPQMRILLSIKAVDFRKGIDGLAEICRQILGTDPFSGCVFVFRNHRATAIKALMYDGQGGDLRVSHPRRLRGWHRHQEEKGSIKH
jgi:transposase